VAYPKAGLVKRWIGRTWLRAFGWRAAGDTKDVPRAVFVAAPHTSNWDLPFTLATAWTLGVEINWVGKHTLFRWPFGAFFRALGGVPVDRTKRTSFVSRAADTLRGAEAMYLIVAPSGSRSRREHWKSGFYHIAREAEVPILLGYLDYAKREGGVGPRLVPTGDLPRDMESIRAFYAGVTPKYPAQWAPPRVNEENENGAAARVGR
jgi:1-acyl-sn-glycerol-3-phosphate acyltransferase